jgi:hypothetical protein
MTTMNPPRDTAAAPIASAGHAEPGDLRATGPSPLDWHDGFVHRHIGPRPGDIAEMLAALGFDASTPSSTRSSPPRFASTARSICPPPRARARAASTNSSTSSGHRAARTRSGVPASGWATTARSRPRSSCATSWRTRAGTRSTRPTSPRSARAGSRPCSTSRRWSRTSRAPHRQRQPARRGHRRRRGDGDVRQHRAKQAARGSSSRIDCHPQTIAVVRTRPSRWASSSSWGTCAGGHRLRATAALAGVLLQYPTPTGASTCSAAVIDRAITTPARRSSPRATCSLTLLTPPGEWGADIAVGSAQRFGVPMGFGGPHAGFIATHEKHVRQAAGSARGRVEGRARGNPALRLAIQTREQHIRRDRATSNICTAQVLLAIIAAMYACYHGPTGLQAHRHARPRADARPRARPRGSGARCPAGARLRHAARRARPGGRRTRCSPRPRPPGSTSATSATAASASRSTRPSTRARRLRPAECFGGAQRAPMPTPARRADTDLPGRSRARAYHDAPGLQPPRARPRCCGTSSSSRTAT